MTRPKLHLCARPTFCDEAQNLEDTTKHIEQALLTAKEPIASVLRDALALCMHRAPPLKGKKITK